MNHCVFTQTLFRLRRVGNLVLAFCLSYVVGLAQGLDLDNLRGTLAAGVHVLNGTVTVTGDLEIPPHASVRVEAGTTLRFDGRFQSFLVQGNLEMNGTASSPITCTSLENSGPNQWGGLVFSLGSIGTILHTEFRFGGGETAGMIDIDQAKVTLENCRFQESGEDGIRVRNIEAAEDVVIRDCLFVDNDDDDIECNDASPTILACEFQGDASAIWLTGTSYPAFEGDLVAPHDGVWIDGAALFRSGTLSYPGIPYILDGDLLVPPDIRLTIAPKIIVKANSFHADILIQGHLEFAGTAEEPIVFTSFDDDERGGDSNNDGDETKPEGDDWAGLHFSPGSTGQLAYGEFYYGGGQTSGMLEIHNGVVSVEHCVFMHSGQDGITVIDVETPADVIIRDCYFDENGSDDIDCQNASPTIHACEFNGPGKAVWLSGTSFPDFNNDLVAPHDGVTVEGTTFVRSGSWELAGIPYIIDGDVAIPPNVELTLPPGSILKVNDFHHNFEIQGTLRALGNEQEPIVFTSDHDDTIGGDSNGDGTETQPEGSDWAGLVFFPGSVGEISHANFFYGGGGTAGMIDINGATISISHCLFSRSGKDGIVVNNILAHEEVVIDDCQFEANGHDDIECSDASPTIRSCRFDGLADSIHLVGTSFPKFNGDLESDGNGIWIKGTSFTRSGTWELAGIPYILDGDVEIPEGIALRVEPGVVIKGHNFHQTINVYGNLELVGDEETPILLTSYLDHEGGIVKRHDYSPRFIDHVKVSSGGVVLLEEDFLDEDWETRWITGASQDHQKTVANAQGRIRATEDFNYIESLESFEGPLRVELTVEATGSLVGSCWDFAIEVLGLSEQSGLLRFDRDDLDTAGIGASPVDSDTCLSSENASIDESGVNQGTMVWEFDGDEIRVGFINSAGEEIPISTQRAGGDLSGKIRLWLAGEGTPSGGNWGGLYFGPTGGGTIERAEFRYGGGTLEGNVQIENTSRVVIRDSVSRYSDEDGLRLLLHELRQPILVENLLLEGNERDGLRVSGGTIEVRQCSMIDNGSNTLGDGISCNDGATMTVVGCEILRNRQDGIDATGAQVTILGNTIAENGSERSSEGYGIGFYNGATGTIENNIIRDNFPHDGIYLDESQNARIINNTISGNHRDGIYADDASALIEENDLSANQEDGIDSENSMLEIRRCIIRDNGFGEDESAGVYAHGSNNSLSVIDSVIVNNSDWGVWNKSGTEIEASDNWWGDVSGPFHDRDNVFGRGDSVSDLVNFIPYKSTATGGTPIVEGDLLDGIAVMGRFTGESRLKYYRFQVPQGKNLVVRLSDADGLGLNHLYLRHGDFPSPGQFDYRHETSDASQRVFVPAATAGIWYVLAYQFNSGGSDDFSIEFELKDVVLFGVTPTKQGNAGKITITAQGGGFSSGSQFELALGGRVFPATRTEIDSYTQLTASYETGVLIPGNYDVRVTAPDKEMVQLDKAFEVLEGGKPKLVTNLIAPSQVGYHQVATIYVEYANEGEVAMPAPLLIVTAEQNGQRKGLMTLDKSIVNRGFWTSAIPEGFSHSVEILASGDMPGVLNAGEAKRIP